MHTRWISLRLGSRLLLLALLTGLVACGNSAATPAAAPTKALSGAATAIATAAPIATVAPTAIPTVASTPTAVPTPTATIAPSPSPTPIPPTASPTLTPRPSPTATRPVTASSSPALRPTGPIPTGWKSFSGKEKPVAITYPPDWSVEEDQDSITFVHPNGVTGVLISALGERAATLGLEQLREQYFTAVTAGCEKTKPQLGEEEQIYGGVVFISMGSDCAMPDGTRWFYIAVGIDRGRAWGILTVEKVAQLYTSIDAYFDPMLASLNFGGQAVASPSPAPTPSPAATRPPTGGTPGAGVPPRGPIPSGWRVYSGKTMPFAIAYPPDWQIQTAYEGLGYVNFVAPDGITTVQIKQAGELTASLGIDRLRELYMEELGKQCGAAARSAGYNVFAGVRFAALRIDCTASGKTIDLYYGTGITNGEEWNISLIAPTGAWEAAAQQFFGPIVDTLTLQGQP